MPGHPHSTLRSDSLLTGPGEMRERVRELDWSATPVGAMAEWPQSLRTAVDLALSSAFATTVLWGPELIQIYNDACRRITGAKHPRALGRPTRETWPEVWNMIGPIYERVFAGETVSLDDARYPLERNGVVEDVFLTVSYVPLRGDDGEVAGVFVTMLETTASVRTQETQAERERLMRELAVERARLEDVFRQAPTFLAVLRGPEHVFHLVNDAYYQAVGHREILQKRVADAIPEVVEQGFVAILDEVLRTGTPFIGHELPIMLQRTPGAELEERFLDFVYQPLVDADGSTLGIVAHGSDVTDQVLARRELEEANLQLEETAAELRASEQRFRDVLTQAPVAVAVLTGPDHIYTLVSPRYSETPGGGRRLLGLPVRDAFPELAGQAIIEILDRVYRTGEPYFANERLVRLDRDGDGIAEEHYFNLGYQPIRDSAGIVYAVASVAYDVTEQMRARRELEIAQQSAESARVEAVTANQAKSAFLTTMSHELRTPLNAVAGYSDLLLLGVRGALTDAQRTDLERIKRSGQYLLGLINDVLNFAKLDAGQVEYRFEDVRVGPLMDSLEELIRPQVDTKGVHYRQQSCAEGMVVRADPEKLRQILLNLLANAVKFTDAGGEVALVCACRDDDDEVRITVRDTGRGIHEHELVRVFDPFVQVDRHLTPMSQQGVGLGLAISRDLALGMGGMLEATSVPGEGSAFTLTLPRARRGPSS